MTAFHEVLFPIAIGFSSTSARERRTQIVAAASGYEERNTNWADSRGVWDVAPAVRKPDDAHALTQFFEARRGRLYGFRFRDPLDHKSCAPGDAVSVSDQAIGTGDGATTEFQLVKAYGALTPWHRSIVKPVAGTVRVALNGVEQLTGWTVEEITGIVTFAAAPGAGVSVTAGFDFDTPARFDTDTIRISFDGCQIHRVDPIPIVEVKV